MEDVFMKYGMIIVGVAVISIMLVFAFQALKKTSLIPEEKQQSVKGEKHTVEFRINKLCEFCLSEAYIDRDCYILDIELTKGNITEDSFSEKVIIHENLTAGNHVVKISNNQSKCEVIKIE